ncbi:MAG TPA: hypothetical protein VGK17_02730 [Propionicimonas sp.]|jgi:hypothetical protein
MAQQDGSGYRNYTSDGTYWTVRKHGPTYWVVRIDNSRGEYRWIEIWGGYEKAGWAGGAAAQLAYRQAVEDTRAKLAQALHGALDEIGLSLPEPSKPSVPASEAPSILIDDEDAGTER